MFVNHRRRTTISFFLRDKQVLVGEDNPINMKVLLKHLFDIGCKAVEALMDKKLWKVFEILASLTLF